jgi:all-trans-8'-apo-beta-carotenal 15,15'-oxygenase
MKSTTSADAIHAALTRNLRREHGFEPMEVEGTLPPDLEGTLYRVGPGLFERFGRRVNHPFEADGAMSAVRIAGGRAEGAVRVVRGRGFQEEERAGRHLYSSRARLVDRLPRSLRGLTKNVANTSPVLFQDRLFAQVELALPTELDTNLHTLGEQDFGGVLRQGMSAHPHRVESLRTTFNFHVQYGREPRFELIALPDSGPVRQLGGFTLPWAGLIHDFAVTDKHACVLLCPAKLVTHRAVLRLGSFDTWFRFHPELGARLLIVPLSAPSELRTVHLEPFWTWHIANAFEDGEGLVIDLSKYPDLGSLEEIGSGKKSAPPMMERLSVSASGVARFERFADLPAEFPVVRAERVGHRHRYIWCQAEGRGTPSGILRIDTETGALDAHTARADEWLGEPVLAPVGEAEADAYVLTHCLDLTRDRTCVTVLRADRLSDGPVCKLWFDAPLPISFHGAWAPGARG